MVAYLTMRLEKKKMNYNAVFSKRIYLVYKDEVDALLAVDGYEVDSDGWCYKVEEL